MDDALAEIGPAQGFQHSGAGPGPAMDELNRPDPAELHLGLGAIEPPGQGWEIKAKTRGRDQLELGAGSVGYVLAGDQQNLGRHSSQGKGPAAPPRRSQGASPAYSCLRLMEPGALRQPLTAVDAAGSLSPPPSEQHQRALLLESKRPLAVPWPWQ